MRKLLPLAMAALLVITSGCGGKEEQAVDLEALYAAGAEACGWTEDAMTDVEGELLEGYYPGLEELATEQLVAKVPAMSSDVNEIVLVQCGSKEDADLAEGILQARADSQAAGGAWYAESMEAWENAAVLRQGETYVALIASGAFQADWEARFQDAFGD